MPDLRSLPSVDQVLRKLGHLDDVPQAVLTREIRAVIAERREAFDGR